MMFSTLRSSAPPAHSAVPAFTELAWGQISVLSELLLVSPQHYCAEYLLLHALPHPCLTDADFTLNRLINADLIQAQII